MNTLIKQILDQAITKQAFLNNYPKPGVVFLALDALLNNPKVRKTVHQAVTSSVNPQTFDAVASIASRGYLFSGMIAQEFPEKGEYLVQKVKTPNDPHYVQISTTTEYS